MPHDTPLIALLAGGLVAAFVLGALAHRFKLSPLVGYLVAGMLVGPYTPGFVADASMASELAEIGVVLLMFGVGLHFSIDDLRAVRKIAFPYALAPIAFATLLGWGLGHGVMGWTPWQGVVYGLALSVASTVVLLKALEENRLVDSERGKSAIGWLIVEDIIVILVLVLLPVFARSLGKGEGEFDLGAVIKSLLFTLGKLAVFITLIVVVGRRLIPALLRRVAGTGSRELFTLGVLAIALGMAFGAAELFGVSIALGAFFAGMLLNESELSHKAAADSLPMRDAFSVLFFVSIGMLFNPNILVEQPLLVLATFFIITIGKPAAAFVVLKVAGRSNTTAFTIAASIAQIGEFSFILAGLAVGLKILPPEARDLVLAAALLSIIANPLAFKLLTNWQRREKAEQAADKSGKHIDDDADELPHPPLPQSGHTLLVGYGRVGRQLAALLRERSVPLSVMDNDPDLVQQARNDGLAATRGNAASENRMAELFPEAATHALLAIPNAFEAGEIIARLRKANPAMIILARAHSDAESRHLIAQGADGAVLAERELAYSMAEMVLGAPRQ
ncbi:MAG: Kef family K(+) transporter [Gammaproteobacteria bacterium]|nr:Kef family K(+) transporter [Gammaproteobacteria bacterium]